MSVIPVIPVISVTTNSDNPENLEVFDKTNHDKQSAKNKRRDIYGKFQKNSL